MMRLPEDLRARLAALDPADLAPGEHPSVDDVLAREGVALISVVPTRQRRRASVLAPLVAVAVVVAVVAVVVAVRGGGSGPTPSGSTTSAVLALGGGGRGVNATSGGSVAIANKIWSRYPVADSPRQVVLIGQAVDPPTNGFMNGDDKIAFIDGNLVLDHAAPAAPATVDGYAVISAEDTLHGLVEPTQQKLTPSPPLHIASMALVEHAFLTDRGNEELPAWQLNLVGYSPAYVIAITTSSLPARAAGGGGRAIVNAAGTKITVPFLAYEAPLDSCTPGFRSTLTVVQTKTSVIVVTTMTEVDLPVTPSPTATDDPGQYFCSAVGRVWNPPTPEPGARNTRTITLASPLGNRVVVDGYGSPYEVTAAQ